MYRIIGADGREYGPISRETLLQWIAESRLTAQSWVRAEGVSGWQSLGSLTEFAGALGGGSPPAPPKPPVAGFAPIAPVLMRRTNSLATASLVMGLLSWCCCCGFPFNLLGVLFGVIALVQINRVPEIEEGRAFAVVGLVLSVLSLAGSLFFGLFGCLAALPDIARELRHL
jgi:hypothetical protein